LRIGAGGQPEGTQIARYGARDDVRVTGAEFAWWYSLMTTTADDLPDMTDVFARPAWHAQAACRGVGVEVFFPARGESTAPAKALCGTCPVAARCREYAMSRADVHGVWGGTSTGQRSVLRGCSLPD
jgi:WhiB family redox-sensing transcriptional regulator